MASVAKAIPSFDLSEPDAALCKLMRNATLRSLGGRPKWGCVGGVSDPKSLHGEPHLSARPHLRNKHDRNASVSDALIISPSKGE